MAADSYCGLFLINAAYFMKDEDLVSFHFIFHHLSTEKNNKKEEYES